MTKREAPIFNKMKFKSFDSKFEENQRVCEKVNNVIHWGKISHISRNKNNEIIYYVLWEDNYSGYREESDLIPLGEPTDCLKEIL